MKKNQKKDDMERNTKAYEPILGFIRLFCDFVVVERKRRENNYETGKL